MLSLLVWPKVITLSGFYCILYLYFSKNVLVNGVGVYLRVSEVVTSGLLMTLISEVMRGIVRMLTETVLLLEHKIWIVFF